MKKKTIKKKNPQDATLRNIRALKKRVKSAERHIASIVAIIQMILEEKKRKM